MNSIQSLFQQTNPYEKFVTQLVELESQTKYKLQAEESAQQEKKTALGKVSSSISNFVSTIEELQQPSNNSFQPFSASSSDKSVVQVLDASGIEEPSDFRITIDRLASQDIVLSALANGEDTDLAGHGSGSVDITVGDRTETITVETTYLDGDGNTVTRTNKEVYEALAAEIREKLGEEVTANTFQVNDTDVQLSIQSRETGTVNQIVMDSGSATGVMAEIAGSATHLEDPGNLDALFTIDGVDFQRGENSVSDAIPGIEFELRDDPGTEEMLTVSRNVSKAQSNIRSFIDSFNNLNKTIRDRTFIDSENDRRGALQDMRAVRNLTYSLRQTGLLPSEGIADNELSRLSEIGIGFSNNGTMEISDSDLLEQMLNERPEEVENLFSGESSVIELMKNEAEAYISQGSGIINSLESGVDQKIDRLNNRISSQERYLEQYEEQQRAMFNELQQIITQGETQFNQVMNFRSSMGY